MYAIDQFAATLPARPRCANDPATDNRIRSREKSLGYRLVEPNTAGSIRWLTFDVDRETAVLDWQDRNAPAPTITCQNPANGHAHLLYALEFPVARTSAARLKPLHYAEMIEHSLRTVLEADRGYSGNLVKNPLHSAWRVNTWADTYSLDYLADHLTIVPRTRRASNDEIIGLGRNCETFERLRKHAYRAVKDFWGPDGETRFTGHLIAVASDMQTAYSVPLPLNEIRAIARSVSRWVWRHFDRATFRQIQSARGSRKGASKKAELLPAVLEMHVAGHSLRVIADTLGINHMTARNWIMQSMNNS